MNRAQGVARRGGYWTAWGVLGTLLLFWGCSSSGGGGATTDAVDVAAEIRGEESVSGFTVAVLYRDQRVLVDLSGLPVKQIAGLDFVLLSDVVERAFPSIDLGAITADFLGSDGFRPGSKGFCAALVPVDGSLLRQGYISPTTRNLLWDESLQYPGCMRVQDTAEIILADKG